MNIPGKDSGIRRDNELMMEGYISPIIEKLTEQLDDVQWDDIKYGDAEGYSGDDYRKVGLHPDQPVKSEEVSLDNVAVVIKMVNDTVEKSGSSDDLLQNIAEIIQDYRIHHNIEPFEINEPRYK